MSYKFLTTKLVQQMESITEDKSLSSIVQNKHLNGNLQVKYEMSISPRV